ncbi:hypothetical protein CFC21_055050 [Triticum aestivum]|uniref:Bifunctional inhibitor/plant lipid transfer protein/seed storage helical domain-containing protein n=2 Tax=Triticum aestivum TaxID=4565 RepID=A0A9R1GFZ0_WHEAT|nr:hypothetical protein CFC21_055050 [Triticum aestivum]
MCVSFVVVVALSGVVAQLDCKPQLLKACHPAIIDGNAPSTLCCSILTAEKECLCGYLEDRAYRQYVRGPNLRKTITSCGIHVGVCAIGV